MSEWRPIDDSPLYEPDNPSETVLLYSPKFGVQTGSTVRFHDGQVIARAHGFHGEWGITHWMPMPEPPSPPISHPAK